MTPTNQRKELDLTAVESYLKNLIARDETLVGIWKMSFFYDQVMMLYRDLEAKETNLKSMNQGCQQLKAQQQQRQYEFADKEPLWQISSDMIKAYEFVLEHYPLSDNN